MKRIEIPDTVNSASNYELEDGRIFRIHLRLITPVEQLANADYVEVETRGFEVDKKGSFIVDNAGMPIMLATQRARIPLTNVKQGLDSAKAGWVKNTLPEDKEALATVLEPHKALKSLPKTGEAGDVKRVGNELFTWTDGLYEQVRRGRLSELSSTTPAPKLDDETISNLIP